MLNNTRCCGSSHGWLAAIVEDHVITWVNPFKDVAPISLPRIDFYHSFKRYIEFNVRKVTLSVDPITNTNDYVVGAIYTTNGCLAFIKAGQKCWTYIQDFDHFGFIDITFYKGLVYAITRWRKIVSFNLCYSSDPYGEEQKIPNVMSGRSNDSPLIYYVKSLEGELWMVRRFINLVIHCNKVTRSLHVFKLELDDKGERLLHLSKIESLGDNILFVGGNDSISVSASYFSNYLQKDSIYYSEDSIYYSDDYFNDISDPYPKGPFDMGIYNVKHGSFGVHCPYESYFKGNAPPIWVMPPFQWN